MDMLSTLVTEPKSLETFNLDAVASQLLRCFDFTSDNVSHETIVDVLKAEETEGVVSMMLTCCDIRAIFMHVNDRV